MQDTPGVVSIEPIAFPAGYIFVPLSLIRNAKDEDKFAGLLARAMSHVALRHATRSETGAQIAELANMPEVFMAGSWANYGIRQANNPNVPLGTLVSQRRYEKEADQMAVVQLRQRGSILPP